MNFSDFELHIAFDSFLDKADPALHKHYVDEASGMKWSSLKIDVTVAPRNVDEVPLEVKTFTLEFPYWCDVGPTIPECTPSGPTLHAIDQTRMPGTYYIALTEEMAMEVWQTRTAILDYTQFHTHGYIPVFITTDAACEALDQHCQKKVSRRKVFKIMLAPGSNLYCRPDKWDKWKHKLFFPIPLSSGDHTDELRKRWKWYKSQSPWPGRWAWDDVPGGRRSRGEFISPTVKRLLLRC